MLLCDIAAVFITACLTNIDQVMQCLLLVKISHKQLSLVWLKIISLKAGDLILTRQIIDCSGLITLEEFLGIFLNKFVSK